MKVFNVKDHGPRFPSGADLTTQDIEFNSTPALDLADAKTTHEIIALRVQHGPGTPEIYKEFEKRADCPLQKARDQVRNTHLESTRQYSQTAYRFGDYVAKYCLQPSSETQRKLYEETIKPDGVGQEDVLHRWLQNFHREHDAEYLLQFQLLENLDGELLLFISSPIFRHRHLLIRALHRPTRGVRRYPLARIQIPFPDRRDSKIPLPRILRLCPKELLGRPPPRGSMDGSRQPPAPWQPEQTA